MPGILNWKVLWKSQVLTEEKMKITVLFTFHSSYWQQFKKLLILSVERMEKPSCSSLRSESSVTILKMPISCRGGAHTCVPAHALDSGIELQGFILGLHLNDFANIYVPVCLLHYCLQYQKSKNNQWINYWRE